MRFRILVILLLIIFGKNGFSQINLSVRGTANSYLVTKAGKYYFSPTRGKSNADLSDIQKADWLWSDKKNQLSDVKYENGKISFNASKDKGNGVIAAFDKNDNILWSWHIWITDDPTINLHHVANANYKLMDRNLGAISTEVDNPESYGLYYQFGRKDPFLGASIVGVHSEKKNENKAFGDGTRTYVINPKYSERGFGTVKNNSKNIPEKKSIEYAVKNPTMFITFDENINETGLGNWGNDTHLAYHGLWGFHRTLGDISGKSEYDPCPYGFKIPNSGHLIWDGLLTKSKPAGKLGGLLYNYEGKDYYYPAAGIRSEISGQLAGVGNTLWLWSAIRTKEQTRAFRFSNKAFELTYRGARATGGCVRCVVDPDAGK